MSTAEKLTTIAENEQRVYDAGFNAGQESGGDTDEAWNDGFNAGYDSGYADGEGSGFFSGLEVGREEGLTEGIEQGKQAQEDAFWDAYQQNGTRTDYQGAFGGLGWTNEFFKPKYDIKPVQATYMFRQTNISGDLVEILDNLGVILDFSECTGAAEVFSNAARITRVGVIDLRKSTYNGNAFAYCSAKTIDKVLVSEKTGVGNFPGYANLLENMTIEGTIAQSGFNAQYSTKLSKASITSIINALSTTTSGLSITLSQVAVDREFAATPGDTGADSAEWGILVETRPNWTINLL